MAQNSNPSLTRKPQEINLRDEAEKYLRYWPWFIIAVMIALTIAFFILRYTTPIYTTSATIIIKDGKNSQNSEMAAFAELGLLNGMNSNSIQNEIGILQSRRLMEEVVKTLDLNIVYLDEEALRSPELYLNAPYKVKVLTYNENNGGQIKLRSSGGNELEVITEPNEKVITTKTGEPVDVGFATILILENEMAAENNFDGINEILVQINPVEKVASKYRSALNVKVKENNSSLVELSLNDPVKEKAQDLLDQLVLEYNREAIEDKNLVAMNTAEFIDERLAIINEELDSVETGKVEFKENNELTDIQAESELFMSNASEFKKRQQELDTQIELTNAMLEYLNSSSNSDLLPANLGIEEGGVNSLITEYNNLVLERNRILSGSTEKNPVVIKLNSQLQQIRSSIRESLTNLRSNLSIAESNLNREAASIGKRIASVPSHEKQFRGIERQQQIKETLYLFLLQKREENSLSLAVTAPKAKIVDTAYSLNVPVSPNSRSIYLTAFLLGLGVPFGSIYLKELFNNKVRSREDLNDLASNIPLVGQIPRLSSGQKEIIEENDRSVLAESFRLLHANLQYFLTETEQQEGTGTSLFVTSTVKGEGKTFIAFNLAKTLANTGKKVLIMGADLRNPQLQRFEKESRSWLGVSNYLVDRKLQLNSIIQTSQIDRNLDILSSGSIPPNPSELLRSQRMDELFEELRSLYDYIIVDTAPSMLVADTFLINKFADLTLYAVRADYTQRKLIDFLIEAKNDEKLKNVSIVLNGVKAANYGYGRYGYSYAYGVETESRWSRLKSAFNLF